MATTREYLAEERNIGPVRLVTVNPFPFRDKGEVVAAPGWGLLEIVIARTGRCDAGDSQRRERTLVTYNVRRVSDENGRNSMIFYGCLIPIVIHLLFDSISRVRKVQLPNSVP